MKVYIKDHTFGAGHWIYSGYFSAWKSLGYDAEMYSQLDKIKGNNYYLMAMDADINLGNLRILENSKKTFLYVQPNSFPAPWGNHPNFKCWCPDNVIPKLNKMNNVVLWTFGEVSSKYHYKWENVKTVLLAFDNINYNKNLILKGGDFNFDVCFIGGRANNGFDEKIKIMEQVLSTFKNSNLRCGFFVDMHLSHEEECSILFSSKVSLNIHDVYQRKLGFDANERTFKALGTTGILVSDSIKCLRDIFPNLKMSNDQNKMLTFAKEYINMSSLELENLKEENIKNILENHTYIKRVEQLLKL